MLLLYHMEAQSHLLQTVRHRQEGQADLFLSYFIQFGKWTVVADTHLWAFKSLAQHATEKQERWTHTHTHRQRNTGVILYGAILLQWFRLKALLVQLGGGFIVFGLIGIKRVSSEMLYYFKQCNEVYVVPRDKKPSSGLHLLSVRQVFWIWFMEMHLICSRCWFVSIRW